MITGQEAGSTKPVFVCIKTGPTVVQEQVLLVFLYYTNVPHGIMFYGKAPACRLSQLCTQGGTYI